MDEMKIGLVSDAHGNGPALRKSLEILRAHGTGKIFFLGDSVGYIPSVSALAQLAQADSSLVCLRGNHEQMVIEQEFYSERESVYLHREIYERVLPFLPMIKSWPTSLEINFGSTRALLVHGNPADPLFGYTYPDSLFPSEETDFDFIFMGNTHRPFQKKAHGTIHVNVGSCGLPRDDGRYGSAAILDTENSTVEIIRFNIEVETAEVLSSQPSVHGSVVSTFRRRAQHIEGRIVS